MKYTDRVKQTRDKLNEVGPGFCLMKWFHQTLYLHTGDNHSCYHPRPHKISLAEIADDPSALHNTSHKMQQRKMMLEGERPPECYYCWNIEDLDGEHLSDRMFHSSGSWLNQDKDIEQVTTMPWDAPVNPKYLEVSFGNGCNFACGYCAPQASSKWVDEIKKHGNYDITYNQYGIEFLDGNYYRDDEPNPYIDAFWKWWPDLKKDLKIFRITGGEPLMNSNTFKLLDMLDKDPAPHLVLNMNSNLGVTNRKVKLLAEKIRKLLDDGKIKDFKLYTSVDSWGPRAEYMRRGLSCDLWEQNLATYMDIVDKEVSLMITYNVLSVTSFRLLLNKIIEWRKRFNRSGMQMIGFDTPYLKEPPHWMMNILTPDFQKYLDEDLQFIKDNLDERDTHKFSDHEYEKFKRVRDYFVDGGPAITEEAIANGRRDFYSFFTEYDKRSFLNLLEVFPEYKDFYELCRGYYE